MNFVYLSPHFPEHYGEFCIELNKLNVTVLGIGETAYESLHPGLRKALTEYYRVDNMEDYDQLVRAIGFFIHKYGRIDRIDSLNEYWLETEARLRTDFNITGVRTDTIRTIKHKSEMKKKFIEAGVEVAEGEVITNLAHARRFIKKVGYPIVAKPDSGVGALNTYKIDSDEKLEKFFANQPTIPYIFESFVDGVIYSFDGLVDRNGDIVFYAAHIYQAGVMETVNEDSHIYYYSLKEIPEDLREAGFNTAKAFDIKERFFHFEYFRRRKDNKIVALEVNMRPPGGYTTDMFNYANDINVYEYWANIVTGNTYALKANYKYHCAYIGRKHKKPYKHSHTEIMEKYGNTVMKAAEVAGIFSSALGNFCYIVRTPKETEIHDIIRFVHEYK